MRISLHLTTQGVRAIATGEKVYSFLFQVCSPDDSYTKPEEGSLSIPIDCADGEGYGEITLPTRDVCIAATVRNLRKKQADLQAEAQVACTKIEGMIQDLLALPMEVK